MQNDYVMGRPAKRENFKIFRERRKRIIKMEINQDLLDIGDKINKEIRNNVIEILTKYGTKGVLVKDCHVMFENDDYSYTVPVEDIVEVKIIKMEE